MIGPMASTGGTGAGAPATHLRILGQGNKITLERGNLTTEWGRLYTASGSRDPDAVSGSRIAWRGPHGIRCPHGGADRGGAPVTGAASADAESGLPLHNSETDAPKAADSADGRPAHASTGGRR